jgi:hypothetical protein
MYLCRMKMMYRQTSALLLLAFFLAITPPELLHELLGHEDTHCLYHPDLSLEKQHVHCNILQVQAMKYIGPEDGPAAFPANYFNNPLFPLVQFPPVASVDLPDLRAPPSLT